MPWRLQSHGDVLAELGPELPQADSNTRSWPMRLTESFERIRALVESDLATKREVLSKPMELPPESVTSVLDPDKRALALQACLETNPGARHRKEIHDQVRALELTIVDDTGAPLEAWLVSIAQIPPGPFESWMRPNFERAGFRGDPPFFMASASLTPPAFLRGALGG